MKRPGNLAEPAAGCEQHYRPAGARSPATTNFGKTSVVGRNLARMLPAARSTEAAWGMLRSLSAGHARLLSAPRPGCPGLCIVCRGPARAGCSRCYQCELHAESAPGGLADLVVPVAYAPKGGPHASNLWLYKSGRQGADAASAALRLLLLAFLHDHGPCLWRRCGLRGPTHLAVVPSGRGRGGTHPLRALIAPYLAARWAGLSARPGAAAARELDPGRFDAPRQRGASILLLDDTWTSGASAQSAAMTLLRAGAGCVIVVVLGRHLAVPVPAGAGPDSFAMPLRPQLCAVHDGALRAPAARATAPAAAASPAAGT